MSIRSRAMEAAGAVNHHRAERRKSWLAWLAQQSQQRRPDRDEPWSGLEPLEERVLLSATMDVTGKAALLSGLTQLSQWSTDLDGVGQFSELLPFIDQDQNQTAGQPQDASVLFTLGNLLNMGSEGGADGIFTRLKSLASATLGITSDSTVFATTLEGLTLSNGVLTMDVVDLSSGANDLRFNVTLTVTRDQLDSLTFDLGQEAHDLGFAFDGTGPTVDLNVGLTTRFTFGYDGAGTGFFLTLDQFTATATIDDGGTAFALASPLDLNIGVLGTTVTGATVRVDAHVDVFFAPALVADGKVRVGELQDAIANDQVVLLDTVAPTLAPGGADSLLVLSGDATFELKVGASVLTVTVPASATADNESVDDLVADVQAAVSAALAGASLAPNLVAVSLDETAGFKLVFTSSNAANVFTFVADGTDPAAAELGLTNEVVALTAANDAVANGQLSVDASFVLTVNGVAFPITILATDTADNTDVNGLAGDLSTALADAGISSDIVAVDTAGGKLVLRAVRDVSITITGTAATELGFADAQSALLTADDQHTAGAAILPALYGQPSDEVDFDLIINGATGDALDIVIDTAALDGNRGVADFLADLNAALSAELATEGFAAGLVTAARENGRYVFNVDKQSAIASLRITALAGDPALTELGFINDQTATRRVSTALALLPISAKAGFNLAPADETVTLGSAAQSLFGYTRLTQDSSGNDKIVLDGPPVSLSGDLAGFGTLKAVDLLLPLLKLAGFLDSVGDSSIFRQKFLPLVDSVQLSNLFGSGSTLNPFLGFGDILRQRLGLVAALTAPNNIASPLGRLTSDTTFQITVSGLANPLVITVRRQDTDGTQGLSDPTNQAPIKPNLGAGDLVSDISKALVSALQAQGASTRLVEVAFVDDGSGNGKIQFVSDRAIAITAADATAVSELGLQLFQGNALGNLIQSAQTPLFDTIQDLLAKLGTPAGLFTANYDAAGDVLSFDVNIDGFAQGGFDVPFKFDFSLDPQLKALNIGAAVTIDSSATIRFTYGIDFTPTDEARLVASANNLLPQNGRLTADATFNLLYAEGVPLNVTVTVAKAATDGNTSLNTPGGGLSLVEDVQAAINAALGTPGLVVVGLDSSDGFRLTFTSPAGASLLISVADPGDTAITELGLANQAVSLVAVTSQSSGFNGQLASDAVFTINVGGVDVHVTVPASATAGNNNLDALIRDINDALGDALATAGFARDFVVASIKRELNAGNVVTARKIQFTGDRALMFNFAAGPDNSADALGFTNGQNATPAPATAVDGVTTLKAGATVATAPTGRVTGDQLAFQLLVGDHDAIDVVVGDDAGEDIGNNLDVDDLVIDFNAALAAALTGAGLASNLVVATRAGNQIKLTVDGSAGEKSLRVFAQPGDPFITEIGFTNGQVDIALANDGFFVSDDAVITGTVDLSLKNPSDSTGIFGFLGLDIDETNAALRGNLSAATGFNAARAVGGRLSIEELLVTPAVVIGAAGPGAGLRAVQDATFTVTVEGEAPVVVTVPSLTNSILVGSAGTRLAAGQNGRLSSNAQFTLGIGADSFNVTLYANRGDVPGGSRQNGTNLNSTPQLLLADVILAIEDATGLTGTDLTDLLQVTLVDGQLQFVSRKPVTVAATDPDGVAAVELGLGTMRYEMTGEVSATGNQQPGAQVVTGALAVTNVLSINAIFILRVGAKNLSITVPASSTTGNGSAAALAADVEAAVNTSLTNAGLNPSLVTVTADGSNKLVFTSSSPSTLLSIRSLNSEAETKLGLVRTPIISTFDLSAAATFTISLGTDVVTVSVPTSANGTVQDLLADVQAAVSQAFTNAALDPGRITIDLVSPAGDATQGKLRFRSAELITISVRDTADTAATQLGLTNAFTATDLTDAINEGLADAGLAGKVIAGIAQTTDGSRRNLIAIGLDSPFQTLTVDFTASPALAAELGFTPGVFISTQTKIDETDDDIPQDVLLGEPLLSDPVFTSTIAPGFSGAIDAVLGNEPALQFVLNLPGVIAGITDANGDAIAFDILVKSTNLLDPGAFTLSRTSSTVAENLLAQDVVDVLIDAGEVLQALFGDVALLKKDLPVVSVSATEFNNFVAPLTAFLDRLTTQKLPSTLQELNRLAKEALNITATGSLFTIDGDRLALALGYANSQTFAAPFVIDLRSLNALADPSPLLDPRTIVSTKSTVRHDITSTATIDLNLALDFTGVDRAADPTDAPAQVVVNDGASVLTIAVSSLSKDLFLTALYGLERVSITAGAAQLGDGDGGNALIQVSLATPSGAETPIADFINRRDIEGIAANSPIVLDGNSRPSLPSAATFTVSVDGTAPVAVTVPASNLIAKPNFSINDLIADINAALRSALTGAGLPADFVRAGFTQDKPSGAPGSVGAFRLQLLADGLLTVGVAGGNPAATILGLANGQSGLVEATITGQASTQLDLTAKDVNGNFISIGTLDILVPDLQDALDTLPGSVLFLGDVPPLDDLVSVGIGEEDNRLEALLRDAEQLITGIDGVIDDIQTVIELVIDPLGNLPVIGDNIIDPLLEFFDDLRQARRQFRDQLIAKVAQNNDIVEEVRKLFFNIFGPGGLNILVDETLDGDVSINDVTVTTDLDNPTGTLSDEFVQWDMHLGQSIQFRFPFSLALGLQNLPGATASIPNFGFELGAGKTRGVTGATPLGSASDTEDGVLDANAVFTLTVGGTPLVITVLRSATDGSDGTDINQSRQDLLMDVQAAIEKALRDAGKNPTSVTVDINDDNQLRIYSTKDLVVSNTNAESASRLGLSSTGGNLTSQDIDLGGGVVLTFSWDFYLGFGLSLGEGFYINSGATDAFGDDVKELSFRFEAAVPQLTGRLALGLVQAQFNDGTDTRVRVTAPGSAISDNGDEITKDFLNLDALFGREFSADFQIKTIKHNGDVNIVDVDYKSLGSVNFMQFLIDLNLELFSEGAGVLAAADFSDVTHPTVIFVATSPDVKSLEITGAENFGFDPFQVEDQRAIGLGFDNGQADATPNGEGKYELTAARSAPTGGRINTDTDLVIRVGGKDARIVLRSSLNDDVESLQDLAQRIQKQLDKRLNQINLLPTDKTVTVEIVESGGESFIKIVADKPIEIRGIDIQEHTGLLVELGVDLTDPDDEDGLNRLTLVDLFGAASVTDVLAPSVTVAAQIRLNVDSNTKHITGALENLFGASEGGLGLPSLNFDVKIDLSLDFGGGEEEGADDGAGGTAASAANSNSSRTNKTLSRLGLAIDKFVFDNVTLDVGDLLNNIIKPIAQGITTVFGPIIDLVGDGADDAQAFLTDPLPVLDELGVELSLLDILDKVGGVGQGIRTLFNAIRVLQGINETIETLGDTGQISFGGWELVFDKESPLYFPRTKVPVPTELAESVSSIGLPSGAFSTEFEANVEPGGFRLDILSIDSIINWILGEPFNIFSFNLPTIDINLGLKLPLGFSIGDFSLGFNISITAGLHIDMGIGYDSTGIQQIIDAVRSGAEPDFADLLDGFFIRNEQGDEISISFDFNGGAALGPIEVLGFTLFEARASVYAGLYAGLDLIDPNEDGKLRISEVMELTNNFANPENLLALFDATLRVYGGFDFSITLFEVTLSSDDLPFPTDFEFEISLQDIFGYLGIEFQGPQPKFAEVIEQPVPGQGSLSGEANPVMEKVLRLNVGPFSYARIFGDTDDSDGGVNYIVASGPGGSILITAFGRTQVIDGADLDDVTKIIGTGTDFADVFNFSALTTAIPIILDTGAGNDVFFGGPGNDTVKGGLGNDTLHGGLGDDDLRGGVGNDSLFGDAGSDLLEGGEGDDTLVGGDDSDYYSFERNWGNDVIIETQTGGINDTIDFALLEAAQRRAALEPRARYRPIRDNLFVTMDIFGTQVTDLSNTVRVNPGSAGVNGFNYPEGHRVERIVTGNGNDLFNISASEANVPESSAGAGDGIEFTTSLDGFNGSDTYVFFGGDPRQVPSLGAKKYQTHLNGSNQLDQAVQFFVAVGDNAPFEVHIPASGQPGNTGALIAAINAALAGGLTGLGLSSTLITAALDTGTGLLTFDGGKKTFFAVYTSNTNNQPRVAPSSNDTQDQLGIPVIHGPMLGQNLAPGDTGSAFDIDRQVTEGTNSSDIVGVTNQLISIRAATQSEADATVITYAQGGGDSGIEVLEVRLRAGDDFVNVESTPATASLLLQGFAGDDIFRIGVDHVNPERGPIDSLLIAGPLNTPNGDGELSDEATFTLEIGQRDSITITIDKTTQGNPSRSLADLAQLIEDAIANALGQAGIVDVQVITDANGVGRLAFACADGTINVYAANGDAAVTDLGIPRAFKLGEINGNAANGPVRVEGGFGFNTLNVFNTGADGSAPGFLDEKLIRGMGMAQGIDYSDVALLNILLSDEEDVFNVSGVSTTTNLYLRNGEDEVNIGLIYDTDPATPDDQTNLIEVEPRNLSHIGALLTVLGGNPSAGDVMNVDASGVDNLPDGETTDTTITGLGMAGSIVYVSIEELNFFYGDEDQTFFVEGTNAGTVTTINAGGGDDLIIVGVDPTAGDGSTGRVVSGINGPLIVNGGGGFDVLYIDDRADLTGDRGAHAGRLSATQIDGLDMGSFIRYFTIDRLNIDLGRGDDVFTILSTHGNEADAGEAALDKFTFITGGPGNDTFTVGNDGTSTQGRFPIPAGDLLPGVDAIADLLDIDGGGGFDAGDAGADLFIFNDRLDSSDNTGALGAGTSTDPLRPGRVSDGRLTGMDMAGTVDYVAFTTVNILLGGGDNEFVVNHSDDHTASLNLTGGDGDDVFTLADGQRITGRIDGKAGIDTLSYRLFTSGVQADLGTGRAMGLFGGFEDGLRNIENLVGSVGADFFTGDDGANLLIGNGGNDLLVGAGGDDTLIGGFANHLGGAAFQLVDRRNEGTPDEIAFDGAIIAGDRDGDDSLFGNAGDDLLIDGLGSDLLNGGQGDDTYRLFSEGFAGAGPGLNPPRPTSRDTITDAGGIDTLDFSLALLGVTVNASLSFGVTPGLLGPEGQTINANRDVLVLSGVFENLIGSGFADTLTGNAAANVITGGAGNDILRGLAGDDTLRGNEGNDRIEGGDGNDAIFGDEGDDDLRGDAGDDTLVGGEGADKLSGGAGSDTADYDGDPAPINANLITNLVLDGFGDPDALGSIEVVRGTAGADTFSGSAGVNIYNPNGGDDTINGNKGKDILRIVGTALADTITLRNGPNPNQVEITIDNANGTVTQTVTLSNFTTIEVNSLGGDDLILINALSATGLVDIVVNAGDGDDTIDGNPAGGSLANKPIRAFGGAGRDVFFSGGADDTFDGGAGVDTADYAKAAVAVNAKVSGKGKNDGHGKKDTLKNVENLSGSQFNDVLTGDGKANLILGRDGNDTIKGGGGADLLDGGDGNDVITAGGKGAVMVGGAGNDTFSGSKSHTISYESSAGPVTFNFTTTLGTAQDGLGGVDTFKKVANIIGSDFADVFTGAAKFGLTFTGAGGDDVINTGNSKMTVQWRPGDGGDTITGGAGKETLRFDGSDAADLLTLTALAGVGAIESTIGGVVATVHFANIDAVVINTLRGNDQVTVNAGGAIAGLKTFTANLGKGDDRFDTLAAPFAMIINGNDGNDVLSGGAGAGDRMDGGAGSDTITYEHAPSGVIAGVATVVNDGFGRKDKLKNFENIRGSLFDDTLRGDGKANIIEGLAGNDILLGGAGNDTLRGGAGADLLRGEAGIDRLDGGEGNDTLDGGPGAPADVADYSSADLLHGVVVDLAANLASDDGFGDVDTLIKIAGVFGSAFADTLFGDALANTLSGNGGDDTIDARAGNDSILYNTGDGDDVVEAGDGIDTLVVLGGAARDTLTIAAAAGRLVVTGIAPAGTMNIGGVEKLIVNTGAGRDNVTLGALAASGLTEVRVDLGSGNDFLDASAADLPIIATGGAGNDRIRGGLLGDTLTGGDGVDTLDFSLAPGAVNASLRNGRADHADLTIDRFNTFENLIGSAFDDILDGDAGVNLIRGGAGNDTIRGFEGNDQLFGEDGDDIIDGNQGNDHISGGAGDDTLTGGADVLFAINAGLANDTILGDAGDDIITGTVGDDLLRGGRGADNIDGGEGNDRIVGGEGSDLTPQELRTLLLNRLAVLDGVTTTIAQPADAATIRITGDVADDFTHIQLRDALNLLPDVNLNDAVVSATEITWTITFHNGAGDDFTAADLRGFIESLAGVNAADILLEKSGNTATLTLIGESASAADTAAVEAVIESLSGVDPDDVDVRIASTLWSAVFVTEPESANIGTSDIVEVLNVGLGLTAANVSIARPSRIAQATLIGMEFGDVTVQSLRAAVESISNVVPGDVVTAAVRAVWTVTLGGDVTDLVKLADLRAAVLGVAGVDADELFMVRNGNTVTVTLLGASGQQLDGEELTAALESVAPLTPGDVTVTLTRTEFSITFRKALHDDRPDVVDDDDTVAGGSGDDSIDAGAGADTVLGGSGIDDIDGGTGSDTLGGEAGSDLLRGWTGADALTGGPGSDQLFGGEGNDNLAGNEQADTIDSGPGDDAISFSNLTGTDTVTPGSGTDTVTNTDTSQVTVITSGPPVIFSKPPKP